MKINDSYQSFNGEQRIYQHTSTALNCDMNFAIYLPKSAVDGGKCPVLYWLSGLTCTERNFIEKSGFSYYFIASFIGEHLQFHAQALGKA